MTAATPSRWRPGSPGGWPARPGAWLLVLDDLRDAADLDGLWPGGPAGRVLITAADAAVVADRQQAVTVPVPVFSQREAMGYLFGRLSTDTDQRSGAYDLAEHLGGEPAALAQASAVMADSGTGCRDYQHRFTRAAGGGCGRRAGGEPPAAAVTWLLSADYAEEQLMPGGSTWPLLLLTALLDSHGIPAAVLTAPAACKYLAGTGAGFPPGPAAGVEGRAGPGTRRARLRRPGRRAGRVGQHAVAGSGPRHGVPGTARPGGAGGSGRATRGMAEGPAPLRPGRPDAGMRGEPAPPRRG